jgi:diguanylate cyclase (GGDEF)-like protein
MPVRLHRRSPEVVSLVVLFAGSALMLLVAVLFPMSERTPVSLCGALIGVATVLATGTYALAPRLPRWTLLGQAYLATLLNGVLVSQAALPVGAMADAVAYAWLTVYVALFFPRAALAFTGFVSVSFGIALLISGLPGMVNPWVLITLTTVAVAVVLGRLSLTFQRHLHTDPLTGALNRDGLAEAERVLLHTRRRDDQLAVAVLDLDGFKAVNDVHGHAEGDRVLAGAVAAWRGVLRKEDQLARTGGDEFVLLMPRTSREQAETVLARLRDAHEVAWSGGVSIYRPGEPLEACIERADRRLYEAKARRRAQPLRTSTRSRRNGDFAGRRA